MRWLVRIVIALKIGSPEGKYTMDTVNKLIGFHKSHLQRWKARVTSRKMATPTTTPAILPAGLLLWVWLLTDKNTGLKIDVDVDVWDVIEASARLWRANQLHSWIKEFTLEGQGRKSACMKGCDSWSNNIKPINMQKTRKNIQCILRDIEGRIGDCGIFCKCTHLILQNKIICCCKSTQAS
jgi:hypothetical protein